MVKGRTRLTLAPPSLFDTVKLDLSPQIISCFPNLRKPHYVSNWVLFDAEIFLFLSVYNVYMFYQVCFIFIALVGAKYF